MWKFRLFQRLTSAKRREAAVFAGIAVLLAAAAAWVAFSQKQGSQAPDYHFTGQTSASVGGRTYRLEDIPANEAEEAVATDLLCPITGDFEKMAQVEADEISALNVENTRKAVEEGRYVQSEAIHRLTTLSEEEIPEEDRTWAEHAVSANRLASWCVVQAVYTEQWPAGMIPQYGNGTRRRDFVVGRTERDAAYRIYDYGMPVGTDGAAPGT